MEILLLTNVWTGATPFFYDGISESKGMPAFNNVFLRLLVDPRISVIHIIIWQPDHNINLPKEFLEKIKFYIIPKRKDGLINSLKLVFEAILLGVKIINKNPNIVRLVGFGALGGITSIIGKLVKIPDFRRIYGTFLINEINDSKFSVFIRHPLEYLAFSTKGKGLLVTNDGTKGDIVFRRFGTPTLPFYFPINGVDKDIINNIRKSKIELPEKFLLYVARLDPWKRQNILIEALGFLKKNGKNFPITFIVGSIFDDNYAKSLHSIIEKFGLQSKVQFIYGLPIQEVHYMLYHSTITFSLYHTSNLGNVFIESLQLGAPMIAINDTGSLNEIDKTAFYELKSDDVTSIADAIEFLLINEAKRLELKKAALEFANKRFDSWQNRAKYEIDLILQ
jgi:glycosyltransferase involved in cell wall biosynthesis